MKTSIWWIRRDLRLKDNQALVNALRTSSNVIPLFILDPLLLKKEAPSRKSFLFKALESLNLDLLDRGSRLILREGEPLLELQKLFEEYGAEKVFAEADFSPYARNRDSKVAQALPCEFVSGLTIYHPAAVRKKDGSPYTVFSPYMNAWKSLPDLGSPILAPTHFGTSTPLNSLNIPSGESLFQFPASEAEARTRLEGFLNNHLFEYNKLRDRLDFDGTSRLSPFLKFGLISARTLTFHAREFMNRIDSSVERSSAEIWINELIWREFYYSILDNFPYILIRGFRENLNHIPWRDSCRDLEAWKNGFTGYPIVDAGMRQLSETGWIHNRIRMITASFLCKDLLINWQEGEKWFMEQLIDGDLASNNGGWQWSAGTGTDAAPYFRIFNPVIQGKKFDPNGNYVRRWLPELAAIPDKYIHSPWEMPLDLQSKINFFVGKTYPKPIVDHSVARERTLVAYKFSRDWKT